MNPKFTARSASCISARENPGPKSYGVAPSHNKGYRPRKCSVKKHTLPERQGSTTMNSIVAFILAETPNSCRMAPPMETPTQLQL